METSFIVNVMLPTATNGLRLINFIKFYLLRIFSQKCDFYDKPYFATKKNCIFYFPELSKHWIFLKKTIFLIKLIR